MASRICHRVALEHQLAIDARKGRPRRGPVGLARHIGQRHVVGARGDAELAARAGAGRGRRGKREVPQVALDAEAGAGHATVEHRLLHVATRRFVHAQRQVARHGCGAAARQAARQLEPARQARAAAMDDAGAARALAPGAPRAGLPAREADFALRIGIGEARVGDGHLDGRWRARIGGGANAPGQLRRKRVERHLGLFEDAGQDQRALVEQQAGLATCFVGVDLDGGVAPTRPADAPRPAQPARRQASVRRCWPWPGSATARRAGRPSAASSALTCPVGASSANSLASVAPSGTRAATCAITPRSRWSASTCPPTHGPTASFTPAA